MRSAAALASAREEVAQVRYSRSGNLARLAAAEPGFGTDRQLRQRLGDVIDRLEGVQRAGAGIADFIDAGVIGASMFSPRPGAGIPLPFTPRRNHRVILATSESYNHFHQFIQSESSVCAGI